MQARYGFPTRGIKVIGVTGTDGKTTTATMIHGLLTEAGFNPGLQTTATWGARSLVTNETHMTVTNTAQLLRRIKSMRREGIDYLILEVTSHALAQNRVWGINYHLAVMTNMSPEHLDFHKTMENYTAAKVKLFQQAAKHGLRTGIVNADDATAPAFSAAVPKVISYGIDSGDLRASNIKTTAQGSTATATYQDRQLKLQVNLPARFNVYNALATASVGLALGLSDKVIEKGVARTGEVAGRMNTIDAGQPYNVVIDFAHTPAAFRNVFTALRPLTKGDLIAVFGATGNRDKTKRPLMAETAAELCNKIVLTQDDDGTEDGQAIIATLQQAAIKAGKTLNKDLWAIHDRKAAITKAISLAKPGDTVVLLGIGHQTTLNTNAGEVPWDEAAVAREAIKSA